MNSSFTKQPGSIINLKVELTLEEFKKYWDPALEDAINNVNLKGFRPGQAPREMAKQHANEEKVFEKAANNAVRHTLNDIIKDNNWTIIDKPQVSIDSTDQRFGYEAKLTIFPEIELGDYKRIASDWIKKEEEKEKNLEVTDKELENALGWLLNSRAKLTSVDRPARGGDAVEADINGKHDQFILGKGNFLPGFEKELENHKKGEALVFSLTAPSDYWKENLRDKKIDFKVRILNVFNREVPALDDDLAQSMGAEFKTVDDLRKNVKEGLHAEKKEKIKEKNRLHILEEIVKNSKIDVPQIMIDKAQEQLKKEWPEAKEEVLKDAAKKRVMMQLVIYKIALAENINPTEEEVNQEMIHRQTEGAKIDKNQFYGYIYDILQNKKVFDFLENQ